MAPNALPLSLPERSIDDIVAERIRVTFGDEPYVLPVRSIESNERFQAGMEAEVSDALSSVSEMDDLGLIFARLAPVARRLLALVSEYDETHILPPLDELRKAARPLQAITAALEVWRAANPLADVGLAAVIQTVGRRSGAPTSSSPRPTAGRRAGSGPNSPTSSSSSISMPPASGSPLPSNRASRRSARGRSSPTTARHTNGGAPKRTAPTATQSGSRVGH